MSERTDKVYLDHIRKAVRRTVNFIQIRIRKIHVMKNFFFSLIIAILNIISANAAAVAQTQLDSVKVVRIYPHLPESFTQGLVIDNGELYESVGQYGMSAVYKIDLKTGNILKRHDLPGQYFGEGICIFKDTIIQLTWKSKTGFVYDKKELKLLRTFSYPTEGWGITHDDARLIMSDGTSRVYFLNPETFERIGSVQVFDEKGPVAGINELEYIDGEIYANIWGTDLIARISPQTGIVLGRIDLRSLHDYETDPRDVLNGIAYDSKEKRLFVTGKLWRNLFEIQVIRR